MPPIGASRSSAPAHAEHLQLRRQRQQDLAVALHRPRSAVGRSDRPQRWPTCTAAVSATPAQDETTVYTYDALNRLLIQSDVMIEAGETTNEPATTSPSERLRRQPGTSLERADAAGDTSQLAYDALGHVTQTLTPNGAASFIEYDAAGMKVRAWTGGLPNQSAQQATNVTAQRGGGLTISWEQPGADSQSWVVWDTAPHDVAGRQRHRTMPIRTRRRTSARAPSRSASPLPRARRSISAS